VASCVDVVLDLAKLCSGRVSWGKQRELADRQPDIIFSDVDKNYLSNFVNLYNFDFFILKPKDVASN
jgi:hypothetical protein